MTFVSASIVPNGYVNETLDGTPSAIIITGRIVDDAWPEYVGAYRIDGDVFAALPAAVPETDGKPGDPRYDAVLLLVAEFIVRKHAELAAIYAIVPVVTVRSAEDIAAMPTITPEILAALTPPPS